MKQSFGRERRVRLSITYKLTLTIIAAALVCTVVGIGLGYSWAYRLLRKTITDDYHVISTGIARSLSRILSEEIEGLDVYASTPAVQKAIEASNARFAAMSEEEMSAFFEVRDKEWLLQNPGSGIARGLLSSEASQELTEAARHDTGLAEIFVTNRFGGLVAASAMTSDYYQADEDWWIKAFDEGRGKEIVSDFAYDESAGLVGLTLAVPIKNRANQVIGVSKAVLSRARFVKPFDDFRYGESGHAFVIDDRMNLVYHHGLKRNQMVRFSDEFSKSIRGGGSGKVAIVAETPFHEGRFFMVKEAVNQPALLSGGMRLWVIVAQKEEEIFAPLRRLILQAVGLTTVLLLLLVPVAFLFARKFISPMRRLHDTVKQIAGGDKNASFAIKTGDEIEDLSDSFAALTADLIRSKAELEELAGNLERQVAERTKQLEATAVSLRMAEENFRDIVSKLTDGIIILDEERCIQFVNPAARNIFAQSDDFTPGKIFGYPFIFGKRSEIEIAQENGKVRNAEMNVTTTLWKEKKSTLVIVHNITDRIVRELELLRASEEMKKNLKELEIFYKASVGREVRILELKKEIKTLRKRLGQS